MKKKNETQERLRATGEDRLRALGYAVIMLWAVTFFFFPPNSFVSALDVVTRVIWMGTTFAGALTAFLGAMLRIDFKMEFPGLLFTLLGPLFYFASQTWYALFPTALTPDPSQRYALIVYAILPGVLLLPRTYGLLRDARNQKKIAQASLALAASILLEEEGTLRGKARHKGEN